MRQRPHVPDFRPTGRGPRLNRRASTGGPGTCEPRGACAGWLSSNRGVLPSGIHPSFHWAGVLRESSLPSFFLPSFLPSRKNERRRRPGVLRESYLLWVRSPTGLLQGLGSFGNPSGWLAWSPSGIFPRVESFGNPRRRGRAPPPSRRLPIPRDTWCLEVGNAGTGPSQHFDAPCLNILLSEVRTYCFLAGLPWLIVDLPDLLFASLCASSSFPILPGRFSRSLSGGGNREGSRESPG